MPVLHHFHETTTPLTPAELIVWLKLGGDFKGCLRKTLGTPKILKDFIKDRNWTMALKHLSLARETK